jgi:hypothetical protein
MMFGGPDGIKASLFSHLYHLKRMARDVIHVHAFIHTFHIDC